MRKVFLLSVLILLSFTLIAQINVEGNSARNIAVQGDVGLGTVIAVVIIVTFLTTPWTIRAFLSFSLHTPSIQRMRQATTILDTTLNRTTHSIHS